MQILDLLSVYFDDAAVVFVTKFPLLFRLALAILCHPKCVCMFSIAIKEIVHSRTYLQ